MTEKHLSDMQALDEKYKDKIAELERKLKEQESILSAISEVKTVILDQGTTVKTDIKEGNKSVVSELKMKFQEQESGITSAISEGNISVIS